MTIFFFIIVILSLLILVFPSVIRFWLTRSSYGPSIPRGSQNRQAILLCNMQEEFLDELSNPPYPYPEHRRIISVALNIIKTSSQAGIPIIYLRCITTNKLYSQLVLDTRFHKDSPGTALHRALPMKAVKIIDWQVFDAFKVPEFTKFLDEHKITSLWIGGMDLHDAVSTTARAAKNRGYNVNILAECTGAIAADRLESSFIKLQSEGIGVITQVGSDPNYPFLTKPWRKTS